MQPASPSAVDQRRLTHLDGLRGLAALFVVVHHCHSAVFWGRVAPASVELLQFGHYAVVVFLVLSGYSLSIATARNGDRLTTSIPTFYRKRVLRIVPPYLAALTISLALGMTVISQKTGTSWDGSVPVPWGNTAIHVLLLQDLIPRPTTPSPNYAFWSIAPEFHFYFLFPLLLLVLRSRAGLLRLTIIGALAALGSAYLFAFGIFVGQYDLRLLTPFLCGMAAASAAAANKLHVQWDRFAALAGLAVVAVSVGPGFPWVATHFWLVDMLVGAAVASLLMAIRAGQCQRLARTLSAPWLLAAGAISYSVYLIHAPIIQLIYQYIVRPLHLGDLAALGLLVVLVVPTTWIVARLLHRYVEAPFMHGHWPSRLS